MDIYKRLEDFEPGLSYKFKIASNTAHILAKSCEYYSLLAEGILRKPDANNKGKKNYVYKFQLKQDCQEFIKKLKDMMVNIDKLSGDIEDIFHESSETINEIVDVLNTKDISKQDRIKIVSYIKNNF